MAVAGMLAARLLFEVSDSTLISSSSPWVMGTSEDVELSVDELEFVDPPSAPPPSHRLGILTPPPMGWLSTQGTDSGGAAASFISSILNTRNIYLPSRSPPFEGQYFVGSPAR